MNLTRADVARLGRKTVQPVRAPGELLAIFVGGKLVNTKNARLHWRAESTYKREWRERVAQGLLEAHWGALRGTFALSPENKATCPSDCAPWSHVPVVPKVVTFAARTHHRMDSDGLQVALAPVRDALIDCGVIHGDADKHGHEFVYVPSVIDRARRGVEIRVSLRKEPTP